MRLGEGAFLNLNDGRLIFVYGRWEADSSDAGASCLVARHSSNGGETWSDEVVLIRPEQDQATNIMSVSLLRMLDGQLGMFYLIRRGYTDLRLHLRTSGDEGKTWGPAVCCVPSFGYYVTNNDRVIRLSSGRLLVPANLHHLPTTSLPDEATFWRHWSNGGEWGTGCFFISDDDGKRWRQANQPCHCVVPSVAGLQETGVIELRNGIVWAWFRTDRGYQYQAFSADEGETWSIPQPSLFRSEVSPLCMKRVPGKHWLLAVWNPARYRESVAVNPTQLFARNPLVFSISRDEGKTWSEPEHLEDDPDCGFSYTAIHCTEASALLAYFVERPDGGNSFRRSLRVRRIRLE